jgi:hypothetical protein
MKIFFAILLLAAAMATAQEVEPARDSMSFYAGYGAWLPGLLNDNNQLSVGSAFLVGVETPMFQANQFRLNAGAGFCGSDRAAYDGITSIMLNLSYRMYPFFKPYAGARGLEPFAGFSGGGIIVWDSVAETVEGVDSRSTGGAMLGVELGARVKVKSDMFFDVTLAGEWVPVGSRLAGEEEKDLSGIRIQGSLIF